MLDTALARTNGAWHAIDARAGEVIAASTTEFTAEAAELHGAPPFGSLVKVVEPGRPVIYALVANVVTGGLDPSRRAVARALPPTLVDGQIYDEYPELRDVLRTEFTARVVGFADGRGGIRHWLPPHPASLHYSVLTCDAAELIAFTARHEYLAGLVGDEEERSELVAAAIRHAAAARADDRAYLLEAGRAVARLLAADYGRLLLVLQRLAPALEARA